MGTQSISPAREPFDDPEETPGNKRPDYRGVRVLVFGASGFIGRWVSRALSARGANLVLAVRDAHGARGVFADYEIAGETRVVDLAKAGEAAELIRAFAPQTVFNLAGYGVDRAERDAGLALRLNAELPLEIAAALAPDLRSEWKGQVLVHAGSALEYGEVRGDLGEETVPNPTTLYGKTKLAGTRALSDRVRDAGVAAVTGRLFTVYGPGEHAGRLLPSLLDAARHGEPLDLTAGVQRRDFTYVEDIARAFLELGACGDLPGTVVNLATGRLTTVREFALAAARVLGLRADQLRFSVHPTRPEEMQHSEVSVDRAREWLGWVPSTGIAEGVRRTAGFLHALRGAGTA